ncbi:MAG: YraN family protein [Flavobacteriales bacterium]
MSESTKAKGDKGEEEAAEYLRSMGYDILEMRWKFERYDLDLVAVNKTHIVFVEVKTRYSDVYGEPWEAVNKAKRKNICRSADAYIQQHGIAMEPRFDIVSIIKIGNKSTLQHIEEAFWPQA